MTNSSVQGFYFASGSSRRVEAHIQLDEAGLKILSSDGLQLAEFSPGEFRISDPIGDLPYRFDFADGSSFSTPENHTVETLFRRNTRQFRWWVHTLEGSWRWVLCALVLLPLITFAFLQYGLPVVAKPIAGQIPQSILEKLDQQVMTSLDEDKWMLPSRATYTQNSLLLEAWSQLPDIGSYNLQQRDGGAFGANAFALPGGTIVVTDQLLEAITSEQQLVAVLAHEIGHVELLHGTRNIVQALGIAAVISTVVGDVSWLAESILVTAPTLLQQMSYSRDFEREADDYAYRQLTSLGIPPSCLGASLQRIVSAHAGKRHTDKAETRQQTQPPENEAEETEVAVKAKTEETEQDGEDKHSRWFDYLSTHPAIEERIAHVGGSTCD